MLLAIALLFGLTNFAQTIQNQWAPGQYTVWNEGHIIMFPTSSSKTGNYVFRFGAAYPDNNYFAISSPAHGVMFSARATGKVGIGTENPATGFHIKTTTTLDGDVLWNDGKTFYMQGAYHNFKINSKEESDGLIITNKDEIIMTFLGNKNIGIGTKTPDYPFDVRFNTRFNEKVLFAKTIGSYDPNSPLQITGNARLEGTLYAKRVSLDVGSFPDYVFEKDYKLMNLAQLEQFIKTNKHLPGVPDEATMVKEGMDVSQMNTILMEKVEELTLHTINQQKEIDNQKEIVLSQNKLINQLIEELKDIKSSINK